MPTAKQVLVFHSACMGVVAGVMAGTVAATTMLPSMVTNLLGVQDLKKKYNAKWALVTGGCGGVGLEIVKMCFSQGISCVIVDREKNGPDIKIPIEVNVLYVQADLRTLEGFNIIVGATKGLDISLLFSNAGCLLLEDYHDGQIDGLDGYIDLMVKSHVRLSTHFYKEMVQKHLKGALIFTSSMSAVLPAACTVLYAASKAFISMLAAALMCESQCKDIDILAVQPGGKPKVIHKLTLKGTLRTKLSFPSGKKISPLFYWFAQEPKNVASVGRFGCVTRDVGLDAHLVTLVDRLFGKYFFSFLLQPRPGIGAAIRRLLMSDSGYFKSKNFRVEPIAPKL